MGTEAYVGKPYPDSTCETQHSAVSLTGPSAMSRHLGRSSIKCPPSMPLAPHSTPSVPLSINLAVYSLPIRSLKSTPTHLHRHPTLFDNMLMYRMAQLACILAAAALCSGIPIEPRSNIRYDQPASNLKQAVPGHNGSDQHFTKDRRQNRHQLGPLPPYGGEAPRGGCTGC